MFLNSAKRICKLANNKKVVIVGIGHNGRELISYLKNAGIEVECIFDNNQFLWGRTVMGVKVGPIEKKNENNLVYVVAVSKQYRDELKIQLELLSVPKEMIVIYYPCREYEYMLSLNESEYKDEITSMFLESNGYDMNWDKPRTYNEIINYEKLYNDNSIRTKLADKCLAREWVRERIGGEYLTKQYGEWKTPYEIVFSSLPEQYVLKMNNGSGRNIVVTKKETIDEKIIRDELSEWMNYNFAYQSLELHYRDIEPKIVCEELLDSKNPYFFDCKIYCFHGNPMYIQCIRDEHMPDMKAKVYDIHWKLARFNHGYAEDDLVIDRPKCMDEMLYLTQILCKDFPHVRVDWFLLPDGRFLFSEMTFSSWSGLVKFSPESYDELFGDIIRGNV